MTGRIMARVPADCVYSQMDRKMCLVDLGTKEDVIKAIQEADDENVTYCDFGTRPAPKDPLAMVKRVIDKFGNPGISVEEVISHATRQGMTESEARKCISILCEKAEAIMTKRGEVMLV